MNDLKLDTFTGGIASTNGYILQLGDHTIVVDAPSGIASWLEERNLHPDLLLLTHQHFDHVEDAHHFDCPIHALEPYSPSLILDAEARQWGLPVEVTPFQVTGTLTEGPDFPLPPISARILHVPGHSPDSLAFHFPDLEIAFVGDTLFSSGIGRTDLPGGNHELLLRSIREKLLTLPDSTRLFPGHGPGTTPADERSNPFLIES